MRKLIYSLIIPVIIGVISAVILLKQFPTLLHPTVTLMTENNSEQIQTSGPVSYAGAVNKAAPAVVSIYTTTLVKQGVDPNSPFNPYGNLYGVPTKPEGTPQISLGSGVIVSSDGHLLTNYHVIENATHIVVALRDGRTSEAHIVGIDPDTDLAVLKINLSNLPTITLGASDNVRVGDVVLAIGNPFNVGQTVTMGIIGATGRYELGVNTYADFIQTDAAINFGNSGGALIDATGNLIGICSALSSESGGSQGIGFAIPSKLASSVLQEIIIHGEVIRGWLGVTVAPVSKGQLIQHGVHVNQDGLVITEMDPKGPAILAGLHLGDLVLAVDDQSAEDGRVILNWIAQSKPGNKSTVTVWRNGETLQIEVRIAKKPIATNS